MQNYKLACQLFFQLSVPSFSLCRNSNWPANASFNSPVPLSLYAELQTGLPTLLSTRVGGGYSEQGLFGTHWYIFDILSNLTSPIFWLFNIDIEGMILVYHRCMMVVLLLQLQLQHQNKITRFRLVKVTNAKNFVFFLSFFLHQIPWIIFTYYLDIH